MAELRTTMKTYLPKQDEIERKWWVVDAEDQILGRLAVKVSEVLRGRHKPTYTPHLDCGDFVIVVNAAKVKLSGTKETQKIYQNYTGGTLIERNAAEIRARDPERLVRDAVWGMMPKGRLGRAQFGKLKVYAGPEHRHEAQKAETLTL